jgi:threonine/homoserine/homoserine lactone efflux protein
MKVFKNGLLTGMVLQLAVGPVFFFIVNLALQRTIFDGFAGVIGVTLADYVYIALAIFGIGKLLEQKKIKKIFGIISSIVLILFGFVMIKGIIASNINTQTVISSTNVISSFISVFLLTISSPLTIVMWTSLFATKTIEYNYTKKELLIFGFATGLATFIFMSCAVILFSLIKGSVPIQLIQLLNLIVGCLLIGYGGTRFIDNIKKK